MKDTPLGRLPADWNVCKLGDVVEKQATAVEVSSTQLYREIGIRSHGKGIFHKEHIRGEELGDKRVFWVRPHCLTFNIVFAWEGAVAVTGEAENGMIASHRFPMFSPRSGCVDVEFLRRFFNSPQGVRALGDASPGGAGRNRTLNQKFLGEILVPAPPLAEQKKIAAILASVDDAIEATQAVIQQLGVVRNATLDELLTHGAPGRHLRFKNSDIGQIPEGWSFANLGACLRESIRNGYSPQCPAHDTGKWTLSLGAVNFDGFNPTARKPAPLDDPKVDAFSLQTGDLLVSRSNTRERVGLAGVYRGDPSPCSYPDLLMRVRTNERVSEEFLELVLLSQRGRMYCSNRARGTSDSMVKIDRAILEAFVVPLPTLDEQREIVAFAQSLSTRAAGEKSYLDGLTATRRAIATALLRGEVRVFANESGP